MADASLAPLLTEFLTAAVHLILYSRRVYPADAFEQRRLYDVRVYRWATPTARRTRLQCTHLPASEPSCLARRSRHPELTEYIDESIGGVRELLERRELDALVVLLIGPSTAASAQPPGGTPCTQPELGVVERFVFEMRPDAVPSRRAIQPSDEDAIRAQLRGFLNRILASDSILAPRSPDTHLSWSLELHGGGSGGNAFSEEMRNKWVECDLNEEVGSVRGESVIAPIKSISQPHLSMQLYVQEAADPNMGAESLR